MRSRILRMLALVAGAVGVSRLVRSRRPPATTPPDDALVDEWGEESFPASDPPAHW